MRIWHLGGGLATGQSPEQPDRSRSAGPPVTGVRVGTWTSLNIFGLKAALTALAVAGSQSTRASSTGTAVGTHLPAASGGAGAAGADHGALA